MRLSLHEVLAIVGWLDDTPGFDTPRTRFRHFLVEHMTTAAIAKTFLDEAQQLISEQYQRALQDTVLAAGPLLGFETSFHGYERHGLAGRTAGQWIARRRLAVTVQLWSDGAAGDPAALERTLDVPLLHGEGGEVLSRLCVVTPSCTSRHRIEEAVTRGWRSTRIVSIRALMELLTLAGSGRLTHDDVMRLLNPAPGLEGTIAMLTRLASASKDGSAGESSAPSVDAPMAPLPGCWVHVVRERLESAAPDVLHMRLPLGELPPVGPGDSVAFMVPSRGVVAHAKVASVSGSTQPSDDEASTVYAMALHEIAILDPPVVIDTEQRLNLELQAAVSHEPYVRVGRREFEELTTAVPA